MWNRSDQYGGHQPQVLPESQAGRLEQTEIAFSVKHGNVSSYSPWLPAGSNIIAL